VTARTPFKLLVGALVLGVGACGDGLEPACLPVVRPGIEVEVRDALTEEFRADSARGVAQDRAYVDSLVIVRHSWPQNVPSALGGAWDRPGTYSVRIERNGYQRWDTSGVRVQADQCGASTVQLVARLSPTS
jgi:hypothetical protein